MGPKGLARALAACLLLSPAACTAAPLCPVPCALQYPITASALGAVYLVGRYLYFVGYATGEPKNRLWVSEPRTGQNRSPWLARVQPLCPSVRLCAQPVCTLALLPPLLPRVMPSGPAPVAPWGNTASEALTLSLLLVPVLLQGSIQYLGLFGLLGVCVRMGVAAISGK